ncbi:MAG: hypothetical protein IPJ82_22980 [Lewinellaceae bacterium]|nr:hypothetical protein [Lewinellaceae bacterium]
MFDIENPRNTDDLDRNEELFLRWSKAKVVRITAGRFIPQSPLINPQDGRMRPTLAREFGWKPDRRKNGACRPLG